MHQRLHSYRVLGSVPLTGTVATSWLKIVSVSSASVPLCSPITSIMLNIKLKDFKREKQPREKKNPKQIALLTLRTGPKVKNRRL